MPKRPTPSKEETVTNAQILAAIQGHDHQFQSINNHFHSIEQRFQNIEGRLFGHDHQFIAVDRHFEKLEKKVNDITDTLDSVAKTVGDIRQEQLAFIDLYKKQEGHLIWHDQQIVQLQTHVGLTA